MAESRIDRQIKTADGFVFIVVDVLESAEFGDSYVVRSDLDGNDCALTGGEEGRDWEYVHIPVTEANLIGGA